jgi:hypothetical protein
MPWQKNVLVVANRTAGSDELIAALERRAERGPVRCTLLMPASPGDRAEAYERLEDALIRMHRAGLVVEGRLGVDSNPAFCIDEVWDPAVYDEVIVSTLPTGLSHWLKVDLPQRVRKMTDAPVEHVVAEPSRAHV